MPTTWTRADFVGRSVPVHLREAAAARQRNSSVMPFFSFSFAETWFLVRTRDVLGDLNQNNLVLLLSTQN